MEGEHRGGGGGVGVAGGGEVNGGGLVMLRKPTPSRPQMTTAAAMRVCYNPEGVVAYRGIESPMSSMVSGFLADQQEVEMDSRSFSHLLAGAISSASPASGDGADEQGGALDSAATGSPRLGGEASSSVGGGAGGSFADRLAARGATNTAGGGTAEGGGGESAPRPPSSGRARSLPPSRIPIPRPAGYLTIPPGLSPTTLFDSSPVLLPTSQV
jgi:hypothetical protein